MGGPWGRRGIEGRCGGGAQGGGWVTVWGFRARCRHAGAEASTGRSGPVQAGAGGRRAVRQDGHAAGAGQGLLPGGEPRPAPGTGKRAPAKRDWALTLLVPLQTYVPTVFENYTACLASEEQRVELSLWDTSGTAGRHTRCMFRGLAGGSGTGGERRGLPRPWRG